MLWFYVVREFGPVKSNFAIFGHIVIGVLAGVVLFSEWQKYTQSDMLVSPSNLTVEIVHC
jgi:drug/metabolite transporter (DMT)-like permease